MTLRLRLIVGLVGLTAVGLTVVSTASVLALRAYLLDRTDHQLHNAQQVGATPRVRLLDTMPNVGLDGLERVITPTDYLLEIRRPNGAVLRVASSSNDDVPAAPLLDSVPDLTARATAGTPFTIVVDRQRFRAVVEERPGGQATTVLLALPLRPVQETVRQLLFVVVAASAAVLLATAGAAWMFLTRGLRPLEDVATTASAIAAGDLSRRVAEGPPGSETGRLGRALNVMLGQIQTAFAARVASQEQLRRFVADASHELRTPLTSIRGYVDLMRAGMISPADTDDALRRLHDESVRMGSLVDDMLYLAHLDEKRPLERREVDFSAVVRDSANDFRAVEPDRPFDVDLADGCVVLGDGDALRQVAGNLLANARVHTPAAAAVAVRLSRVGTQVVLEVADQGPGMSAEVASRVFDRFYRAADGRERRARDGSGGDSSGGSGGGSGGGGSGGGGSGGSGGGSGLGLAIVAAGADAHGGRAQVFSVPGEGTTFRVTLPAAAATTTTVGDPSGTGELPPVASL